MFYFCTYVLKQYNNTVLPQYHFQMRINGPRTNYDAAMLQFEQLINNKHFLLTFIDILESQKSFNIRDK